MVLFINRYYQNLINNLSKKVHFIQHNKIKIITEWAQFFILFDAFIALWVFAIIFLKIEDEISFKYFSSRSSKCSTPNSLITSHNSLKFISFTLFTNSLKLANVKFLSKNFSHETFKLLIDNSFASLYKSRANSSLTSKTW